MMVLHYVLCLRLVVSQFVATLVARPYPSPNYLPTTVLLELEMLHSRRTARHMCREQYSSLHHSGKDVLVFAKASWLLVLVVVFPYNLLLPLELPIEGLWASSSGEACSEVLFVAWHTMLRLHSGHCCDVRVAVEEPGPLPAQLTRLGFVSASFSPLFRALEVL